ncbi:MAG: tRNA (adenosine(37)-N6)-threonylcarbamoyltransferase complex transferase subunit TsaD [Alphaproteobacteria bacterium]|jgi:N6-L-threonylcarbamoyladenine synthase|nr:tRNA (adenosine(37)-N6)-threonylcarbamoyltransferase complex transferase subunit TsaD [Alphaproteobacteria bacterium]
MIVLGIETSCDETAAAIVRDDRTILSNVLVSQIPGHQPYGGVVPEKAARAHLDHLQPIIEQALKDADVTLDDLDGIAVTAGPGLIGGVLVGVMTAKAMAAAKNLPFIAVNHLEGHALTGRLTHDLPFPFLLLLISGGHSQFLEVSGVGQYRLLGSTIDDAVGEAFDKVARIFGLSYPGGPALERLALNGNGKRYELPRPLKGRPGCDFSFSGLKTAVRMTAEKHTPLSPEEKADLAASFQEAVADCLEERAKNAIQMLQKPVQHFVVAGGVAANATLRARLSSLCEIQGLTFTAPPIALCTDNAAMIAWVGIEKLKLGLTDTLDFIPRPRWPLCG